MYKKIVFTKPCECREYSYLRYLLNLTIRMYSDVIHFPLGYEHKTNASMLEIIIFPSLWRDLPQRAWKVLCACLCTNVEISNRERERERERERMSMEFEKHDKLKKSVKRVKESQRILLEDYSIRVG
jgi:hypothetical protein